MRLWLKPLLWISATFVVVWMAAIFYWQNTTRMPAQSELLIYLGALPLVLIGVGWGVHKAIYYQSAPPTDSAVAAKLKGDEREAEKAHQEVQQRGWHLNIVAAALQTSAGNSASEVLAKLKSNDVQPELDPELKNDEGFAVFSARIADLDFADTQEALQEWAKTGNFSELQWSPAQLRALHLASSSLEELTAVASMHPEVSLFQQRLEQGRTAADAVPNLMLIVLWPQRWDKSHQLAASHWIKTLATQHGWPEQRISLHEVMPAQSSPFELLDQMCLIAGKTQIPAVGILLACDSGIDQDEVDSLISHGHLFGGKTPGGNRPGEVAAGLLIADERQSRLFENVPHSKLNRASWGLREKSADERGKISSELLNTVVAQALSTAKLGAELVKFVSADNDHNPNREAELAQMLNVALPDLDCVKDAAKVAQTCGSAKHALTTAALCVAHQHVVDEQLPAMCVSLNSPFMRGAVVLTAVKPA